VLQPTTFHKDLKIKNSSNMEMGRLLRFRIPGFVTNDSLVRMLCNLEKFKDTETGANLTSLDISNFPAPLFFLLAVC
jgi:hypothetical protein